MAADLHAPAVDEHAVAAVLIANPPAAILERHHRVLAADVGVLDAHGAIVFAADVKGAAKSGTCARLRCERSVSERRRTGYLARMRSCASNEQPTLA